MADRSSDPNYRDLEPAADKPETEYQWPERRAVLYDMIEERGSRSLLPPLRELADRFGVGSHTTIRKDLEAIAEWESAHLGDDVDVELSLLRRSATQSYLEAAHEAENPTDPDEDPNPEKAAKLREQAYSLSSAHLKDLQSLGEVERAADRIDVEADVDSTVEREVSESERALALDVIRARQESDAGAGGDE